MGLPLPLRQVQTDLANLQDSVQESLPGNLRCFGLCLHAGRPLESSKARDYSLWSCHGIDSSTHVILAATATVMHTHDRAHGVRRSI